MSIRSCTAFVIIFFAGCLSAYGADRVAVGRFEPVANSPAIEWLNPGIQQTLLADLPRGGRFDAITLPASSDALSAARQSNADWIISGSYQVIDNQIRLTGQIIDAASGSAIGGIKITGNVRDLFELQDDFSRQALAVLRRATAPTTQPADAVTPAPALAPTGPVRVIIKQPVSRVDYDGSALQRAVDAGQIANRPIDRMRNRTIYDYGSVGYYRSPITVGSYAPIGFGGCRAGYTGGFRGHYSSSGLEISIHRAAR